MNGLGTISCAVSERPIDLLKWLNGSAESATAMVAEVKTLTASVSERTYFLNDSLTSTGAEVMAKLDAKHSAKTQTLSFSIPLKSVSSRLAASAKDAESDSTPLSLC